MLSNALAPQAEGFVESKRCKPDYETMIERANERLGKNKAFQDALFDYIGGGTLRGKMAELVGELVSEQRQLSASIADMIASQEADTE